jgi:hypothetical protein
MTVEDKTITSSPFAAGRSISGGRPASTPLGWPTSPMRGAYGKMLEGLWPSWAGLAGGGPAFGVSHA